MKTKIFINIHQPKSKFLWLTCGKTLNFPLWNLNLISHSQNPRQRAINTKTPWIKCTVITFHTVLGIIDSLFNPQFPLWANENRDFHKHPSTKNQVYLWRNPQTHKKQKIRIESDIKLPGKNCVSVRREKEACSEMGSGQRKFGEIWGIPQLLKPLLCGNCGEIQQEPMPGTLNLAWRIVDGWKVLGFEQREMMPLLGFSLLHSPTRVWSGSSQWGMRLKKPFLLRMEITTQNG